MNNNQNSPDWYTRGAGILRAVFWIFLIVSLYQSVVAPARLAAQRTAVLENFQEQRNSRVIALIHRQEQLSLFGIPFGSFIDIEDSEAILRAIRRTPKDTPIDLILHTPGGLVLAATQIAQALAAHPSRVTVFVPHYAMSGGTLISLAADQIVMDANAVLGPVDPQIGDAPAASLIEVVKLKDVNSVDDQTLILADVATKARKQVYDFVHLLLLPKMGDPEAANLARTLSEGRWTHDFPITATLAASFGLPISTEMPTEVYNLMDLYPQGPGSRPSVLYVPFEQRGKDLVPESVPSR